MEKEILVRLHAAESTRVLDEITRKRRLRKQLEALEQVFFSPDNGSIVQFLYLLQLRCYG